MKTRKKNILLILSVIVCVCVMSACGAGKEKTEPKQEKQTEEEPKEEEKSAWEVVGSVDEFGDADEDSAAILSIIKGTFTNSAVTDEELTVKTYISPNAGKSGYIVSFYLYEYNDQKATFLSSDELRLKTKIDDQVSEDNAYETIGKAPTVLVGNGESLVYQLQRLKDIKCVLYIGTTSKYNFTIPCAGINKAMESIDIWGPDHAKQEQKEAEDAALPEGSKPAEKAETIKFGKYEQDNNKENGKEDIEWLVLEQKDGKRLLLSKVSLDAIPYNDKDADVTWETCSLRKWLNEEFLQEAFSKKEQDQIIQSKLNNDTVKLSTSWKAVGCGETEDKVFLLSYDEAFGYLSKKVKIEPSPYAKAKYNYDEMNSVWLRSNGMNQNTAMIIDRNSKATVNGYISSTVNGNNYILPAIWIKEK